MQLRAGILLVVASSIASGLCANTFVPVTITTTTWTKAGSPYIVAGNATVQAGHVLTIEPGVEVILGPEVEISAASGRIRALGTREEPIQFRAASPEARWQSIEVLDVGAAGPSLFRWCIFSHANHALFLHSREGELVAPEISNCVFEECGNGILIRASRSGGDIETTSRLDPLIQNCRFVNCTMNGILVHVRRTATASPTIRGNIFLNPGEAAIDFTEELDGGHSQPQVINNTIMNAPIGISTRAPYDLVAKNNLFVGCESAIHRWTDDSLSFAIRYNNFHNNGTNFVNYPDQFGFIIWDNANGDPADIHFNIFEDPLIADAELLTLHPTSPCIDAGDTSDAYLDSCFPPSQGTPVNDIGAYGGPSACGWVDIPSTVFNLEIEPLFGITINPIQPGTYRLESAPTVGNPNHWTQITSVNLESTPWTYVDHGPAGQQRVYRAVLLE